MCVCVCVCVLSRFCFYGAECWAPLRTDRRRLDAFHHQCLCDILILSWEQRKSDRITYARLRLMWGDFVRISDRVHLHQREWLDHVAINGDDRLPKRLLFSSLPFPHPAFESGLRWMLCCVILLLVDAVIGSGLRGTTICWRQEVVLCIPDTEPQIEPVPCPLCHRLFHRLYKKRHACTAVCLLPLHLQPGAA